MENLNLNLVTLIVVLLVGATVLFAVRRRAPSDSEALKTEITRQNREIEDNKTELRTALSRADRAEGLAEERKAEIDRLNGDLSKHRHRIDEEQATQTKLESTIARLETQMKTEHEASSENINLLISIRDEMQARFKQLADESLKAQGEAFSKANLETEIDPTDPETWGKTGRNAPFPCGSGKKYKQCHGRLSAGATRRALKHHIASEGSQDARAWTGS